MPAAVPPVPAGYHSVTPYLLMKGAAAALDFYKRAFGAEELMRMPMPDGTIAHAEIKIGDSPIMLADEGDQSCDLGQKSPATLGATSVSVMLYVPDVDAQYKQALAAGATELRPVKDQFYGDRSGTLRDPYGHVWTLATHVEEVSPEEIERRLAAMGDS